MHLFILLHCIGILELSVSVWQRMSSIMKDETVDVIKAFIFLCQKQIVVLVGKCFSITSKSGLNLKTKNANISKTMNCDCSSFSSASE